MNNEELIWEKEYGPFKAFGYVAPEELGVEEIFDADAHGEVEKTIQDINNGDKVWVLAQVKVYCKGIELGDGSMGGLLYKDYNGIKKEMNMREKMQWDLMNSKLFRGLSLGDQEKHMNAIKSDYFSYAKEAILGKKGEIGLHPDLSTRINDRKNFMDEVGQSPPKGLF